ncbi:hypothetical protein [Saccharopolyspora shandongensis]|uniref:hypothetical protein n=1 Tax=Saccharopolyspora shandongensis TaxID=418495 RepID=UPI00340B5484
MNKHAIAFLIMCVCLVGAGVLLAAGVIGLLFWLGICAGAAALANVEIGGDDE